MIDNSNLELVFGQIEQMTSLKPYVSRLRDPFRILVGTVLSARTKDETTAVVTEQLFKRISKPQDLIAIDISELEQLIYKTGFYKTKARYLKQLSRKLIDEYDSSVPNTIDELVKLPGVGRKTANLVVITAFGKPGICVDTHVHRIVNRWGYVKTRAPDMTETELRKKLPKRFWEMINERLVAFGKQVCKPIRPLCDKCSLSEICPKIGVLQKSKTSLTENPQA